MSEIINLYGITLDFIFKIAGPVTGIIVIGLCYKNRKPLSEFILNNVERIKGKVFNQEIDIELRKREQGKPVEVEGLDKDKEQLIKELEFEKIYSIIFGSQIEILKLLRADSSMSKASFSVEFQYVRSKFGIYESWSEEDFLTILLNNKLIEDKDDFLTASPKGLDFLRYIEENNYNDRLF